MILGVRGRLFLASALLVALSALLAELLLVPAVRTRLEQPVLEATLARARLAAGAVDSFRAIPTDGAAWDELADSLGAQASGRITLLDPRSGTLGDSELHVEALARAARLPADPQFLAAAGGRESVALVASEEDGRLASAFVPTSNPAAPALRLSVPLADVERSLADLQFLIGAVVALTLLCAAVLSGLSAHWLSRIVQRLADDTYRAAQGELGLTVRAESQRELGALGRAVNELGLNLNQAMGQLRAERDLLSGILDGMEEGVLLIGSDGKVARASPALRTMLALEADPAGKAPLEMIRSSDLQAALEHTQKAGEPASAELELALPTPRRLQVRTTRLSGEPQGVLAAFADVTEMRRLETLRRDFVANVSHELRTPVATIRSAAETLETAISDPDAARRFLAIIGRSAERMQRLVDDLLDLARIESRQVKLAPQELELGPALDSALTLHRDRAEQKQIRLAREIPAGLRVCADRRAFEQIVGNLVDNAIKYCPEGSLVLVRASAEAGRIRCEVVDDGPGIEEKHLPRLFERFYRVDSGRSRELGGTGLGLSIVKHLAETLGGKVGVESAPGRGATFWFTLPLA